MVSLGFMLLDLESSNSNGVDGRLPLSIRGVILTPIWETCTDIWAILLLTPLDSSFNSSISEDESMVSLSTCSPVDEKE